MNILSIPLCFAFLILFAIYGTFFNTPEKPLKQIRSNLSAPLQQNIYKKSSWLKDGFKYTALASYVLRARIVRTRNYWLGRSAAISPIDVVAAWGKLSDSRIINQLTINLGDRYYTWQATQLPIAAEEINRNMANVHLVPSSDGVLEKIKALNRDDIVKLSGYLIKVETPNGWSWISSTTREDNGDGACELMWVDSVVTGEASFQ